MKNNMKVFLGILCLTAVPLFARTSSKEKDVEHMAAIVANALNNHTGQVEKSIANIGEMVASQIQNFMLDFTLNNPNDKDSCRKILEKLDKIEILLAVIIQQLVLQKQVLGNPDDVSVDPNDLTVADIDNAQISLVSLAKTILRAQIAPIS
jgi:hypothetical protein